MPMWVLRAPQFQSTPSGGKATRRDCVFASDVWVSIHAFRGEGDTLLTRRRAYAMCVSIPAFRGEGDDNAFIPPNDTVLFQSTPSGGKAT